MLFSIAFNGSKASFIILGWLFEPKSFELLESKLFDLGTEKPVGPEAIIDPLAIPVKRINPLLRTYTKEEVHIALVELNKRARERKNKTETTLTVHVGRNVRRHRMAHIPILHRRHVHTAGRHRFTRILPIDVVFHL